MWVPIVLAYGTMGASVLPSALPLFTGIVWFVVNVDVSAQH